MAIHSALLEKKRPAGGKATGRPREGRSPRVLAGALAASWALPLLTHAVHADIVLLPALVLAVASVLRAGGGLLDRLVVAGLLVCGAVMAFGLLFSVWPWGLHPVPTAGVLLSTVALAGWAARRRPRLPLRLRGTDLLVLGTAAVVWRYLHHVVAGRSAGDRLAYILTSEDRMGHFSYFDGIHQIGGYAFLNQDAARAYMMTPAEAVYPQGSHFLLAWIDVLARSATDGGAALGAMNRYFLYVLAANAVLCAAVVWAARWIGGPRLRGWRAAAVCATVAGLMLSGLTVELADRGFDSEVTGLLFLTVTTALLLRPALGRAEYLLVAVAGLVTVTYVYNLYGPFVGVALLAGLLAHRRRFAYGRRRLLAALAAGLLVAGLPSAMSVLTKLDVAKTSNLPGPMASADRVALVGCGLLVLLAVLMPANRRIASAHAVLLSVLGIGSVLAVFGLWQKLTIGYYSYYFEKLAMAALFTVLLGLGTAGALLRPPARSNAPRTRRRLESALTSAVAAAAALSLSAHVQWGFPSAEGLTSKKNQPTAFQKGLLVGWSKGDKMSDIGAPAAAIATRDLRKVDTGRPIITLYTDDSYQNLRTTFLAQLLTRQAGHMVGYYELFHAKFGGKTATESDYRKSLDHLVKAITSTPQTPTVLVGDHRLAQKLTRDLEGRQVKASVVWSPLQP